LTLYSGLFFGSPCIFGYLYGIKEKITTECFAEEHISKAELRLTDIADAVQKDWIQLAAQLGVGPSEVTDIQADFDADVERALVMLHLWVQSSGRQATGNDLERALSVIGRPDVIRRCMYNVKEVTDVNEKAAAKGYLDKSVSFYSVFSFFPVFFRVF